MTPVDPQIRLQNISLETQELLQQRSMSWTETTNRASSFMTIVGASVFGLALVGNATDFSRDFLVVVLLVLPVLLFVGASSLGRMGELDLYDWRLIQGLNRLRRLRIELDPTMAQYLVTSTHDDVYSVLESYGDSSSAFHSFYTLAALMGILIAVLAAFTAATAGLVLGADTGVVIVIGLVTFVLATTLPAVWAYRSFKLAQRKMTVLFPAPTASTARTAATAPNPHAPQAATASGEPSEDRPQP
jgi:hypothetical protein